MKKRWIANFVLLLLALYSANYAKVISEKDPVLNTLWRLNFGNFEENIAGIKFIDSRIVVATSYRGIAKHAKNGHLIIVDEKGNVIGNTTLLHLVASFDASKRIIALGTANFKWLNESTFTFSPFYLIAYSPNGSELWRRKFNATSVSTAGDLIVARGYIKNGSIVRVFDIGGNELWSLDFGDKVTTNGKVVAVAEKGKIYLFSRNGKLIKAFNPWKGAVARMGLTDDGKLVVVFYSRDGQFLGVYDRNGNFLWGKTFLHVEDFAISQKYLLIYDGVLHIFDWSGRELWSNTKYHPLYPEIGIALGKIALSPDGKFIAYGNAGVKFIINPLFDRDKDGILDENDAIPINNGLFLRIVMTLIVGGLALWVNLWERKKEREEARKRYEEIKNRLNL
ncbi:hypothetical protein TERMP_00530 [Thermococcus barophilus MP]|uniref:Uncharacterized protein n=1 Tax=Thermococcus barophilus (strain DSM 11836 / MP) TaxID=391623 RepID=F0LJX0_THEBM|nr:hypothetical protein TERMP_00530 [Thermococcus barophilus MP]